MWFSEYNSDRFSGDGYEDPPVPISNTVVKLVNAESTWLATAWEDRKLLIKQKRKVYRMVDLLFLVLLTELPLSFLPIQSGERGIGRELALEAQNDSELLSTHLMCGTIDLYII